MDASRSLEPGSAGPAISVVVPVRDPRPGELARLCDSLLAQTLANFEVVLVDDGSRSAPADLPTDPRFRLLRLQDPSGPATARNRGAVTATAPLLLFTDVDCWLAPETLAEAVRRRRDGQLVAGETRTVARSRLGAAVARLGFPGGGSLGFDRVWRVDPAGLTHSFSACNVSMTRCDLRLLGGFDESFPVAAGEDTVLARTALESGLLIRYSARQLVFHGERNGLLELARWQLARGRGSFHIRRRLGRIGDFLRLRKWSFDNSLKAASTAQRPFQLLLIVSALLLQGLGFGLESVHWLWLSAAGRRSQRCTRPGTRTATIE